MQRNWQRYTLGAVAAAAIAVATISMAAESEKVEAAPPGVVTVFLSKGIGGKSTADAVNKLHVQWLAKGYTFVELDPYIEDGDLEGLWVTYKKE